LENNLELEKNEHLVASFIGHTEVKKSTIAASALLNLICPIAGICNRYKLTITNKNLYIEQLSYVVWGGLYDTVHTDKFNLNDIKIFDVTMIEDNQELIKIVSVEGKEFELINSNSKNTNIASEVSKILNKR
jgi:hypothetical protein